MARRRLSLAAMMLLCGCSKSVGTGRPGSDGSPEDGTAREDHGPPDASDAANVDAASDADAAAASIIGRVQVTQQDSPAGVPTLSTQGHFIPSVSCDTFVGGGYCTCVDDTVSGCARRTCSGFLGRLGLDDLLGYGAILPDERQGGDAALDAGTLQVRNGTASFEHGLPDGASWLRYDAVDDLPTPWQAGDAIVVGASGGAVPPFSTTVAFPPRVTFLQPDLRASSVAIDSDLVNLRWTPAAGAGTVEATAAASCFPDAHGVLTIIRCTAPVDAGQLNLPVPPVPPPCGPDQVGGRGLAVRVINASKVDVPGLTTDVNVACYDSGRLDEALPTGDGGDATASP